MSNFYAAVSEELRQGQGLCLSFIINRLGSAPREVGASFLVRADGSTRGTIGGGRIEGEVTAAGRQALAQGQARLMHFHLRGVDVAESQMICGGDVDVYLEPVAGGDPAAAKVFAAAARAAARGERALLVTAIAPGPCPGLAGRRLLLCAGRPPVGGIAQAPELAQDLGGNLDELLTSGRSGPWVHALADGGKLDLFLEPITGQPSLYIFGGGHISLHLAPLVKMLGFRLVVIDDRPEYANRERFPLADEVWVMGFAEGLAGMEMESGAWVVIVTRGHLHDKDALAYALQRPTAYVGMIGSRRKRNMIFQALEKEGFSREQIMSVHSPIGLDIGAETPEEIAVAIAAELVAVRSGKSIPPRGPF